MYQLQSNLGLAQQYYTENAKDFTFWASTYQNKMAGTPASALTESKNRLFYQGGNFTPQYGALDYTSSVGRGQSKASLKFDRDWFNTRRKISKYNVGVSHRIDYKFAMAKLNSEFEGWNLGFRYEDHRKMMYDEQRHAHQAQILNIGIGAGNAARIGLATSVQTLSESRSQRASMFGALSNGLGSYAGFNDATQGIKSSQNRRFELATTNSNPDKIGGMSFAPDVSKQQMNRVEGSV